MPIKEIKCFRDLYQVIKSKKNEKLPVSEIKTIFYKYDVYQKSELHQDSNRHRLLFDVNLKNRKVLYFILEKLYMANSKDLHLVSSVIKKIYEQDEKYFNNLITDLFHETRNFGTDQILQMLEYCLKYTYMKKMLFDGFRMATVKFFFPRIHFSDKQYTSDLPKVMGILIRYGMLLDPVNGEGPTFGGMRGRNVVGNENRLDIASLWGIIINDGILRCNPHFLPVEDLTNKQRKIFNSSLEMANLLIRDSVEIGPSAFLISIFTLHPLMTGDDVRNALKNSKMGLERIPAITLDIIQKLGRFIPGLPKRCLEPTSLKHGCKRIIRKMLHLN